MDAVFGASSVFGIALAAGTGSVAFGKLNLGGQRTWQTDVI
jgi:hypothetical protein